MTQDIDEIIKSSSFTIHDGEYVYLKAKIIPNLEDCFMVSKDKDEITAIVERKELEKVNVIERNIDAYKLIELKVSLPFYAVGFLAAVTKSIAVKGGNCLIVSTYSKDYALVRTEQLTLAVNALMERGFIQNEP